jgi:solute carrier family 50 protein (sugar transporter)
MGAAKLQYYQLRHSDSEESISVENNGSNAHGEGAVSRETEFLVFVSQEVIFLRIMVLWFVILVCVGWLGLLNGQEKNTIGVLVNINLIFFYGAPLQTMQQVINEKCSDSIHTPTMVMNWFNTSFWLMYGLAKFDPVIYLPNMIGLFLGITQGVLCLLYYPRRGEPDVDMQPLLQEEQEEVESEVPVASNQDSPGILS